MRAGFAGIVVMMLVAWSPLSAAPVTNTILDYYEVERSEGKLVIEIFFTLPVFYMSHFPITAGDTLTIMVRPIAIAGIDSDSFVHREGMIVRQRDDVPLVDIEYEGENGFNSYLIVYFTKQVHYTVTPGDRFESVRIELEN
jgi:hypothetical protein